MRIRRLTSADETGLRSDKPQMGFVTMPFGFGDGQNALIDPDRQAILKREQGFEPCSYFIKHASRRLTYKTRSALLPRGAAQLINLHNATDLEAVSYRHVKTPIAITSRNRAGDATTGQFIKDARR